MLLANLRKIWEVGNPWNFVITNYTATLKSCTTMNISINEVWTIYYASIDMLCILLNFNCPR